jgi:predicted small lipoprotein YifL
MRYRLTLTFLLILAVSLAGCGLRVPFFGDKKVEQDEPVVQDATDHHEEPQYSGTAAGTSDVWNKPAPASAPYYAQPAPAPAPAPAPYDAYNYGYGNAAPPATGAPAAGPYPDATGAYGAAQPYQQPQPGAAGMTSGYPASGTGTYSNTWDANAQTQPGVPYGSPPQALAYGTTAPGTGIPSAYGTTPQTDSFFTSPEMGGVGFQGIKRKAVLIISYPQREISTVPMDNVSRQLQQRLSASPALTLLPQEAVSSYVASHQLSLDAAGTGATLARVGRELGAHTVIFEKVTYLSPPTMGGGEGTYQFEITVYDVSSGYPLKSYTLQGNSYGTTPTLEQVTTDLTRNVAFIDWYARIVKVDQGRLFINAGRQSGLQVGQKLRIYGDGDEVIDPTTKMSLGKAQGKLKGIVKITDFFGLDGSICEAVSGSGFAVADMAKSVD